MKRPQNKIFSVEWFDTICRNHLGPWGQYYKKLLFTEIANYTFSLNLYPGRLLFDTLAPNNWHWERYRTEFV